MITVIRRADSLNQFDQTSQDYLIFSAPFSDAFFMRRAAMFAKGQAYRIEFHNHNDIKTFDAKTSVPYRTLEQAALPLTGRKA